MEASDCTVRVREALGYIDRLKELVYKNIICKVGDGVSTL